jgi:membrane protein implicated in regulation of membrane protease activity
MRDSNTSRKLFTSSAAYFAIVFGAGFVFGTVRVVWLVPTVGVRLAELTELPLMLAVVFFAARWVNRRFLREFRDGVLSVVGRRGVASFG